MAVPLKSKPTVELAKHVQYFKNCYNMLPGPYCSQEGARMTLMYFVVSGLDLLDALTPDMKREVCDFVYSLQVTPDVNEPAKNLACCGFRGSPYRGVPFDPQSKPKPAHDHDHSHIAMTYVALCLLYICDDDLSRLNRTGIVGALKQLQCADGSYMPVYGGSEADVRFVFCAAAISTLLNDWSGMDRDLAINFITRAYSYEQAYAQAEGQEAHGGSTYCAIAALALMGRLDAIPDRNATAQWCLMRQQTGFQGRINKVTDTCYSFWVGATLVLLDHYQFVDTAMVKAFSLTCQHAIGGFGKWPNNFPDVLHSYFALCGLSLLGEPGLQPLDPALGISRRAATAVRK